MSFKKGDRVTAQPLPWRSNQYNEGDRGTVMIGETEAGSFDMDGDICIHFDGSQPKAWIWCNPKDFRDLTVVEEIGDIQL